VADPHGASRCLGLLLEADQVRAARAVAEGEQAQVQIDLLRSTEMNVGEAASKLLTVG
jgi:hypothetical protein